MYKKQTVLYRIASAFNPYKMQMGLSGIAILVIALLGLLSPWALRDIFDRALPLHSLQLLGLDVLTLAGIPVVIGAISIGQTYLSSLVGQRVIRDLRSKLYRHLQALSFGFFTSTRVGEIQSRLSNDIGGIQLTVTDTINRILLNVSILVSTVVAMIYISPLLTLVTFVLLPIFALIALRVGSMGRRTQKETQQALAALSAFMNETLSVSGVLLIKTFGHQQLMQQRFERENQRVADLSVYLQLLFNWSNTIVNIVFSLTPAAIYLVAGWQVIERPGTIGITLGGIVAFTVLQARLLPAIGQLLNVQVQVHSSLAFFERIFEYLDLPIEIADAPQAIALEPTTLDGKVTFEDVVFNYKANANQGKNGRGMPAELLREGEQSPHNTLDHLSFEIKPGQLVALVGPSGAGKTTVTYLIPRLYDVDSGAIKIDGHDVRDISAQSLSDLIGMVTQETYLFHASIRENLLYARPDATEEEMIAATKAAAIHTHIMSLEKGYDTIVGERGYKLSGGEKQRIAIARVILKNPRILILDEATSSLDTASERLIQSALAPLMKNRTTLAIAHRLSTILSADLILVMDQGRIVERGTHQQLLQQQGLYAQLYHQQFLQAEDAPAVLALEDEAQKLLVGGEKSH